MDLIEEIEALREDRGMTKADMARAFGLEASQNYNNWVYRGSLPKDRINAALKILGRPALDDSQEETEEQGTLTPSHQKLFNLLDQITQMSDLDVDRVTRILHAYIGNK